MDDHFWRSSEWRECVRASATSAAALFAIDKEAFSEYLVRTLSVSEWTYGVYTFVCIYIWNCIYYVWLMCFCHGINIILFFISSTLPYKGVKGKSWERCKGASIKWWYCLFSQTSRLEELCKRTVTEVSWKDVCQRLLLVCGIYST